MPLLQSKSSVRAPAGQPLLLSIDFEDWNQIVDRLLGHPDWNTPNEAFPRQVTGMLSLLEDLEARATFFVLGMTAEIYPDVVRDVFDRGHEVASHGYAHHHVHGQSPKEFREDVARSVEVIERLTGQRPLGYRAPMYSLTRQCVHALETLVDLGFMYDSSQVDAGERSSTIEPPTGDPFLMRLPSGRMLWQVPLPTARLGAMRIPIGGGSYWRVLPAPVLSRALLRRSSSAPAALYFHPYEFDSQRLNPRLPSRATAGHWVRALFQTVRYNPGRARVATRLRAVSERFTLLPYGSYLASISSRSGPATLSREGVFI